jgi:hypothetical protein
MRGMSVRITSCIFSSMLLSMKSSLNTSPAHHRFAALRDRLADMHARAVVAENPEASGALLDPKQVSLNH